MRQFKGLIFFLVFALVSCEIDPTMVSVSGISSGGYMATQYQFAFSSTVRGAAVFAGGPFYCARNQLNDAFLICMYAITPVPLDVLEADARRFESAGEIDPLSNLSKHKVYIYSGTLDATVKPSVVKSLEQMYRDFQVNDIVTQYSIVGAHNYPTINYGNLCTLSYTPYISRCNYDGAGDALAQIYGNLFSPVPVINDNILTLDQNRFTPGGVPARTLSLDNDAFMYVPNSCRTKTAVCKLHVAFHGCQQARATIGMQFIQNAGYNSWAEANDIIILYPQTIPIQLNPSNPNGCWDWWGYLNADFATKKGPQMQTIKNMVDYLLATM